MSRKELSDDGLPEDSCACCLDGAVYEDDEIVFCDKCDVACHQKCYGIARIPKGNWYV